MNQFEVPCPSCGSIEVVVGDRAQGSDDKAPTPEVRRCACRDCRHRFQHDFSFSR